MNNLETLRERKRLAMSQRQRFDTRIQTLNQLIAEDIYETDEAQKTEKGSYPRRQIGLDIRDTEERT